MVQRSKNVGDADHQRWGARQAQPLVLEVALVREACYRTIGEAYFQEPVSALANFSAWFQNELCGLLQVWALHLLWVLSGHACMLQSNGMKIRLLRRATRSRPAQGSSSGASWSLGRSGW